MHKGTQASPYYQFAIQAQSTGIIKLFEGSEQFRRDFIPVEQVLGVQYQFVNQDIDDNGIWNVGTGTARSFREIAQDIANQYGALLQEIPFPDHLSYSYQRYTCADLTKLQQTLKIDR
jgi:ADP-L-glycero-D-manno-heptose 6-epimerase